MIALGEFEQEQRLLFRLRRLYGDRGVDVIGFAFASKLLG
jgi:hypothetical protein